MATRNHWRLAGCGLLIACLCHSVARANAFTDCVERVYAQDVVAKQAWHRSLRDLTVNGRPDLATLATLDMNLQLAQIDQRHAQFGYLTHADPTRIHTREGLARFRNFEWAEADALILRRRSPAYVALERRVSDLGHQTKGHPDWNALHEYSRTGVSVSPQFRVLLNRLQDRERVVERDLTGCPSQR